jgi:hypothetical protein
LSKKKLFRLECLTRINDRFRRSDLFCSGKNYGRISLECTSASASGPIAPLVSRTSDFASPRECPSSITWVDNFEIRLHIVTHCRQKYQPKITGRGVSVLLGCRAFKFMSADPANTGRPAALRTLHMIRCATQMKHSPGANPVVSCLFSLCEGDCTLFRWRTRPSHHATCNNLRRKWTHPYFTSDDSRYP